MARERKEKVNEYCGYEICDTVQNLPLPLRAFAVSIRLADNTERADRAL
jgi:hypothetical protein